MTKVFIDGSAGTTGLRIHERLTERKDIELLTIPDELRKDPSAKKEISLSADVVFLCLPDDAAREAVANIGEGGPVIIDTSTAHRTDPNWTYGMPELKGYRERIAASKRIANPGCHASGFVALVQPLVEAGIISKDELLTCFSITGYSGGGKKMIADYESETRDPLLSAPRQYALTQNHKHLKEMSVISSLNNLPIFSPIVSDFYCGMEVTVPIFAKQIKGSANDIKEIYKSVYNGPIVNYCDDPSENGLMSASKFDHDDGMEISVLGNDDRILLVSRFDNLGKGASGAAIQNMNIVLGCDETTGLSLKG
ncbi:MAG: N-acetyl-gamma-glutamyl-phosphate reductase [Clostridia bacterium]|nr:N-acetyl-gamma-glutamyl-phosphate reductase [Clostridia bacterium]